MRVLASYADSLVWVPYEDLVAPGYPVPATRSDAPFRRGDDPLVPNASAMIVTRLREIALGDQDERVRRAAAYVASGLEARGQRRR